jgi:hypothetical protein
MSGEPGQQPVSPEAEDTPLFGCGVCGRVGWSRVDEHVIGAGEEAGYPEVRKTRTKGGQSGAWLGDCGHAVGPETPLAAFLDALAFDRTGGPRERHRSASRDNAWEFVSFRTSASGNLTISVSVKTSARDEPWTVAWYVES